MDQTDDDSAGVSEALGPGASSSFDPVAEAKRLLRTTRAAALATLAAGHPFTTLVNVATDYDGSPILLLSQLAAHTRHLNEDARLSLLFAQSGRGDPLAHPRLTLLGRAEKIEDAERRQRARARFLNRHPKSSLYADFTDFAFYRVAVGDAHLNGGFARAAVFPGAHLLTQVAEAADLIACEGSALDHVNAEHSELPSLFAQAFARRTAGPWRVTGFDPEGLDLAKHDEICRVAFPAAVNSGGELRQVLMDLAAVARRYVETADREGRAER